MAVDFNAVPSPCFLLDESLLDANLAKARELQAAAPITMLLALKGFALPWAFPKMSRVLSGVTASSLNEALLGAETFGKDVHVYAPAYKDEQFAEYLKLASHITFNSLDQWERFRDVTLAAGVSGGIRINPEYSPVTTDLYNPCAKGSRLGVTRKIFGDDIPEGLQGFHSHNLCECDAEALEKTVAAIEQHFGDLLPQISWLNLGGGHLFTRKGYDTVQAVRVLSGLKERYPNLTIIMEPGAAYVWETGYLVSTVLDVIKTEQGTVLLLDTSFSAHMPDCLEMPYQPRILGAEHGSNGNYQYTIGGMTCLAGDQMGIYSFDHEVKVGERIVFKDMMHYTFVKTTMFNGVEHPSLGVWTNAGKFELIRQFGYEDYKRRFF